MFKMNQQNLEAVEINQHERKYFDHTVDPSLIIMYRRLLLKDKIFKYTFASIGVSVAIVVFIIVLHFVAKI